MTEGIRTELAGRGWTLSVQRLRAVPTPGRSSNLGAAAIAVQGSGRGQRIAARLAPGERLWISVAAPSRLAVAVRTADGRALAEEGLAGGAIRRFAAMEASEVEGVGAPDVPLGTLDAPWTESLSATIGRARIPITLLPGEAFDAIFGSPPRVEGEPESYGGWRLP